MKWWVKALIVSGIWVVVTIGVGMLHTNVILGGKITPQQDEAISGAYGMVCVGGVIAIWIIAQILRKKKSINP